MCTVCGCGSGETRIGALGGGRPTGGAHPRPGTTLAWRPLGEPAAAPATPPPAPPRAPDTTPGHHHLDFGSGPAHAHAPGLSQAQMLRIERISSLDMLFTMQHSCMSESKCRPRRQFRR